MPRLSRFALDGRLLVLVVVMGGLFTLQASNSLDVPKVVYLALATASTVAAIAGFLLWHSERRSEIALPWVVSTAALLAMLTVSVLVSHAHGTPLSSWLRDTAPYALFAAAPVLALA